MKDTEAAYFAGLIDGEGTVSLRRVPQRKCKRGWNWRPLVQVANSDNRMIQRISEITGRGWGARRATSIKGRSSRPGQWRTTGCAEVIACLAPTIPYLVTKRTHADLLLEACKLILSLPKGKTSKGYEARFQILCPRLQEIHGELAKLNRRGERWRTH